MTSVVAFCRWQKQPRAIALREGLITRSGAHTPRCPPAVPHSRADTEPPTGQSSQKSATGSAARKEPLTRCNAPPTTIITWCARYTLLTATGDFYRPSLVRPSRRQTSLRGTCTRVLPTTTCNRNVSSRRWTSVVTDTDP